MTQDITIANGKLGPSLSESGLEQPPVVRSIFEDDNEGYEIHDITIVMRDKLMGGVPANPKTIEGWLQAQAGIKDEEQRKAMLLRTLQELGYAPESMTPDQIDEATDKIAGKMNTNTFKRDSNGLYIEGRQVMSMLRENAGILFTGHKWRRYNAAKDSKGKAATSLFRETVHVPTQRIHLGRSEPDNTELKIVHPQDPTRESSLTYVDYVEGAELNFRVEALEGVVEESAWKAILKHAERNGLGAMRSQQHGKFAITAWERVR
jgi:hypothetical protein